MISNCTPLKKFPEATIKVYNCILLGFRFAHTFFLKPLQKSIPHGIGGGACDPPPLDPPLPGIQKETKLDVLKLVPFPGDHFGDTWVPICLFMGTYISQRVWARKYAPFSDKKEDLNCMYVQ